MHIPRTIRAAVSPEAIERVTRLFNGTDGDILAELFQNARRAQATRIDVELDIEGECTWLTVSDDGIGIADPVRLMSLGASSWEGRTREAEDPAGMGFYALAGRETHITSSHDGMAFSAVIAADAWTGQRDIELFASRHSRGTAIRFPVAKTRVPFIAASIAAAARYLPVKVFASGAQQRRDEFLQGAYRVTYIDGVRVGIYQDRYHSGDTLNFHGVTLRHKFPVVSEVYGRAWTARIDIINAADLKLVLPARKELVENEFLANLKSKIKAAIYETIGREAGHSLDHTSWQKAQALGVALAPASPQLRPWTPSFARDASDSLEPPANIPDGGVILEGSDSFLDHMIARGIALHPGTNFAAAVHPEPCFAGYEWYDRLPVLDAQQVRIGAGDANLTVALGEDKEIPARPDSIALDFISHPSGEIVSLKTDLYVADSEFGCAAPGEIALAVTRISQLTPAELADTIVDAAFCPSDDSDSDSYDTQETAFRHDAIHRAYGLLEGGDAGHLARIRAEFDRHIHWLVPKGKSLTLSFDGVTCTAVLSDTTA